MTRASTYSESWSAAYDKTWEWTKEQGCEKLDSVTDVDIEKCKSACEKTKSCTVIHYKPTTQSCVLRACKRPVQKPTITYDGWFGYHLLGK